MKIQEQRWTTWWIWKYNHIYTLQKTNAEKPIVTFNKSWTFPALQSVTGSPVERVSITEELSWTVTSQGWASKLSTVCTSSRDWKSSLLQPLHILLWNYKTTSHSPSHLGTAAAVYNRQTECGEEGWERDTSVPHPSLETIFKEKCKKKKSYCEKLF